MNDLITEGIIRVAQETARMVAEEEEKPSVTTTCFADGCDEDIVRIERYHVDDGDGWDTIAVWELKDGRWVGGSKMYHDKGTHLHLFCAAHPETIRHKALPYRNALKNEADMIAHAEYTGERGEDDYDGFWTEAYERTHTLEACPETSILEEGLDQPGAGAGPGHPDERPANGHERKAWGNELPEVLQRVVYPGSFSEVKHEDAEVEERPRRWRNYNRAKSVTKQMLTEIVDTAIEAVQQGRVPDGVRELKDGRLVFSARKLLGEHGDGPKQTIEGRANRLKAILNENLDRAGFVRDARMGYRRP